MRVDGKPITQFTALSTAGGSRDRIDGYIQAIGDGTPLGRAKRAVRALLPSDAHTVSYRVLHTSGDSCALWTLRSRTLGHWLAGTRARDSKGDIVVNLNAVTTAGFAYRPSDVSEADVSTRAAVSGPAC